MRKIISSLLGGLLVISVTGLWLAQHYWIDKDQLPMSPMPSWKISILKLSQFMPWPESEELHLDRIIKLSNAVLHREGDHSLKSTLSKLNDSLLLLISDERRHDLMKYPNLEYKRLLEQITLMHRGAYFLARAGRRVEIEEKFRQFEIAFHHLDNPSVDDKTGFLVEQMIHQIILNKDVLRAKGIKDELFAALPADSNSEQMQASINLYFGYALCLSKDQDGANYIQHSVDTLSSNRNALIWLTARNWDTGLLGGIELENQNDSACVTAVERILTLMKSKGE